MPVLTWNGGNVIKAISGSINRGMTNAVLFLEGEEKKLISRPNPHGDNPSLPGEPPKRVTGTARADVGHAVTSDDSGVHGFIGVVKGTPADDYFMRLEWGFQGTDKLGRNINQAPRPSLRVVILSNRDKVMELIAKG